MPVKAKRSFTGRHALLPARRPKIPDAFIPQRKPYDLLSWTFGTGSVIWRIWPAVLLHTAFAALVVSLHENGILQLAIPNVMLTVLGVVIGFVISYRAISGYDRYWMGRTCWSDVVRNCRTMGRLIWFHTLPALSPRSPKEKEEGQLDRKKEELLKVMAEKRMALDLLEGFAIGLKHHLRGETGIYFEDLYHLVRPLHDHDHIEDAQIEAHSTVLSSEPERAHRIASQPAVPRARRTGTHLDPSSADPIIPPLNAYGTFTPPPTQSRQSTMYASTASSTLRRQPSHLSATSEHEPLQPAQNEHDVESGKTRISRELIPFAGLWNSLHRWFSGKKEAEDKSVKNPTAEGASTRKWGPPVRPRLGGSKHMDHLIGENLPLEILRCLSEWYSVLEERGTCTQVGGMIGLISSMEDSLAALERILTTPLPFVYSVHIRHTVWIYLFFLPFQLLADFSWYTIPGVCIAAFIYLGFLAAGEEIEQPFGYDENDLDLDMFTREIIHVDIENLKKTRCLNSYFEEDDEESDTEESTSTSAKGQGAQRKGSQGSAASQKRKGSVPKPPPKHRSSMTLVEASQLLAAESDEEEENHQLASGRNQVVMSPV